MIPLSAVAQLKELLSRGCKVSKVQPAIIASDAEVNIVIVTIACHDGSVHTVKAYEEEAQGLREFVRSLQL